MKLRLRDGSFLKVDDNLPEDQVRVLAQNAEDQLTANPDMSLDPAETDDWGTYIDKHVKSTVRAGVGGLASTGDFIRDAMYSTPHIAYNLAQGKPAFEGFGEPVLRDAYEKNVVLQQPRGSDYETNAKISEVVVPGAIETMLTGSPKTAPFRFARDVGGGLVGGEVGEFIGDLWSPEAGQFGRTVGSVAAPLAMTPANLRRTPLLKAGVTALDRLGIPASKALPAMTWPQVAGAAVGGGGASAAYDYQRDAKQAETLRYLDEQNRLMMEGTQ